ncbi:MAG: PorT family protein [Cyclobacteriaceae bacterium]|nr:PorT family protein [Cyclobacteriaceae bacterium]
MKNFILSMALLGLFQIQNVYAQLGVQAGVVGILGEAFPTADGLDKLGGAMGFTAGLLYEISLSGKVHFQPAVNLVTKSWKDELLNIDTDDLEITKVGINYLEIPLSLVFRGSDKGFFAGVGPSIMMGLSGKRTVDRNGNVLTTDYQFGSGDNQENPLTIGVNVMAGYSFGSLFVNLNFNQGLTNQPGEDLNQGNVNHLALRAGYIFGKK